MVSPFPGMNPYLENPLFWTEIHNLLIVAIFRKLNPQLRPKYKVAIEKRVYQSTEGIKVDAMLGIEEQNFFS
jgi:hypothetical protein